MAWVTALFYLEKGERRGSGARALFLARFSGGLQPKEKPKLPSSYNSRESRSTDAIPYGRS